MKLVPWRTRDTGVDIFDSLEDFQREMNRLFDSQLNRPVKAGVSATGWMPAVDVVDEKDQIRVKADLPGLKKEEIEVLVDNGMLTIKGEKKEEKETKEKDYIRSERFYGAFHRSFTLPAGVDAPKVHAGYKDGVLEITLPKKEDGKSKQVKVDIK